MDEMKSKLANFWYYYRIPVIIVVITVVALISIFSSIPKEETYDLQVAVVSAKQYPDEQLDSLKNAFSRQYGTVKINEFTVDLGKLNQEDTVLSLLDLDLAHKTSSVYLLQNVDSFFDAISDDIKFSAPVPVGSIDYLSGLGFDDLWVVTRE